MATTRVTGRGPKSPVDEEFLKQLYQGGEMLAQGLLNEARVLLERAHQLQPRNEKGRNLLGLAYFKLGHFDRAAEVYEALVRDNPVDATLRVNLGLVYLKTNALQRAMREFEAATDLQPDHKKAHNYLGLALAQAGEYGRARHHFLQSGNAALAEKMAKAIAGERVPKPSRPALAPSSRRETPPGEGQWGAQFGLDEMPAASAPPPDPSDSEELRFDEEGDEDAVEAAPPPPPRPPPAPVPPAPPPPESVLDTAAPELPRRAPAPRPARDIPLLTDLTPALALAGANPAHRFRLGPGSFSVFVEGELLTRLEGLVAFSGQLEFEPERKRFRGRATDEPFGDGAGQFTRVSGRGVLFLESPEAHSFLGVDLGDAGVYVREECVFAFEEVVAFENGKMPSTVAPDLALVYLRGQGRVVLAFQGALRSVAVSAEFPVTVPMDHLVGWQGRVTPEVVPLPGAASASSVAVQLSGEGFALITLPVR
ncbi:tetratricopeptide repeat protein [Archangium primigenium]|uniref:tetratricopeptide repeat protein n=1 Tax=[Archangium] primigenium TaxID=2792470 RepID=UPI00195D2C42|nr:tetratricopeptide repeat protein [Archangium primigenium]MBM7115636.1 tetratricopeptide repeat protein [Archangium primigenium]